MGYHLVNLNGAEIEHEYVESELEIVYLDNITENTIIYQGEKHWKPIRAGDDSAYKCYTKDWFRAGLKAQELFKKQAKEEKLMLEELFQDEKSFQQYLINDEYLALKRGDFLVRNHGNIEVDIKCRAFYEDNTGKPVFNFKCDDVEKHLNMQSLTKTPVFIAVYERNGDSVIEGIPYFFSINETDFSSLSKVYLRAENTGYCYQIPLEKTVQDFDCIKNQNIRKKSFSIEEKRKKHRNAYKIWTVEEDEMLELHFCENKTIKELSSIFGRNRGAINSRIEKLELRRKYDNR